jgi:alkyl sulfatase BDS1-like metallo-beta-lactamase superfamily hydrolase
VAQILRHATLTHRMVDAGEAADVSVTTTRATLDAIILKRHTIPDALASGALRVEGDTPLLAGLLAMLDPPPALMFEILTPGADRP